MPDYLPIVDRVPGMPVMWVAGGFSGHGMLFGLQLGQLLAEALASAIWPKLPSLFGSIVTGRELQFHDRADFDGAMHRIRDLAGHFDGFIQIFAIAHVEARELLLRFGERAINDQRLAVADADGCRSPGRLQCVPTS